ncbi:MAG: hypothetical protein IE931_14390 [Sphingobacteriales bacterium]|nr:hypothetical protein [Sphingobacteriales bacterium]
MLKAEARYGQPITDKTMTLTDKHITYENDCRQMFVGQIILAVIYGELKYYADEDGNNINPKPYYKTKYPEIDTLDHSIYFKTDNKTIYVFWDNTFICYGLQSKQLDLTETTNDFEQKWDVSTDIKWLDFIGQKIVAFKIIWEETWTSNLDGSNKVYTTYPQTFEIITENGKTIILSASEFKREEENEIYSLMDNLLVTTNIDLARHLKLIE